jgi:Dolichyl-phosphate-mannose-protein mannosyltransferase
VRKHLTPGLLALAGILAGALALRLYGLEHGLPFIYHSDESQHFTSYAVEMFDGSLNPHYFQNPATYTYLVYLALKLHGFEDIASQYLTDPTEIYETARLVAVALSLLGVAAVYSVGRRLWGASEGVVAAAVLAFAFLPVAYSRYAVTDVGVLFAVCLAAYAMLKIHEDGARRYYLIAGLGLGLTVAFKFTAGLILVPILVAIVLRALKEERTVRELAIGTGIVAGVSVIVFFLTNPYFVLDLDEALDELRSQRFSANEAKLGQKEENPFGFYLGSLTWGLGWGAIAAAAVGLVWELRRNRMRALLLALFPLLLFLYLGSDAERYFARWLMPTYPILALFAGVAVAGVARSVSPRGAVRAAAVALLIALVMAQPIVANLRTGEVMGRADTRELARNYMLEELPSRTKIVVDNVAIRAPYDVPLLGIERTPDQPEFFPRFGAPPKKDKVYPPDPVRTERFVRDLSPARIDRYRDAGYCTVITMSWLRERAEIAKFEPAIAYYDRLERESKVLFVADPYDDPDDPVEFDFDQTHLYYDARYNRTGPRVEIRKLDNCENGVKRRA